MQKWRQKLQKEQNFEPYDTTTIEKRLDKESKQYLWKPWNYELRQIHHWRLFSSLLPQRQSCCYHLPMQHVTPAVGRHLVVVGATWRRIVSAMTMVTTALSHQQVIIALIVITLCIDALQGHSHRKKDPKHASLVQSELQHPEWDLGLVILVMRDCILPKRGGSVAKCAILLFILVLVLLALSAEMVSIIAWNLLQSNRHR
jgi:hypothetical protein